MRPASWSRRGWAVAAAAVVVVIVLAGGGVALLASEAEEPQVPAVRASAVVPGSLGAGPGSGMCAPLEYGGDGRPDLAIAATEGARWPGAAVVVRVLEERGWRAGPWRVGVYRCNQDQGSGKWERGACTTIGEQLASPAGPVGLVGPLSSGCAHVILFVLGDAGARVAIVSGTSVWTCLTRAVRGCFPEEGERLPSGVFARVLPSETIQAAALVELAVREGLRRLYVVHDRESYGQMLARGVRRAARLLGVEIAGSGSWNPRASDYRVLMREIRAARPDGVVLAGLVDENGVQVVRDKVAVLGPNDGPVRLLAPDGFFVRDPELTSDPAAQGLVAVTAGVPVERLPERGRAFAAALDELLPETFDRHYLPWLVYSAQAAEVLLDAIARSDGTRPGVLAALSETRIEGGLVGDFGFDEHGDTTLRRVTAYRLENGAFVPHRVLDAGAALVEAAAG